LIPKQASLWGRTVSKQVYSQGPDITAKRKLAKEQNKDAMVLNEDELSAGPPLINGVRRPDWTTNDEDLYQTAEERKKARYAVKYGEDEENCEGGFCAISGGKTRNKKTNRRKRKTNRRKRFSRRKK